MFSERVTKIHLTLLHSERPKHECNMVKQAIGNQNVLFVAQSFVSNMPFSRLHNCNVRGVFLDIQYSVT